MPEPAEALRECDTAVAAYDDGGQTAAAAAAAAHMSIQAVVMKALLGLCTVMYKSFPTTIQADKAILEQLQQQQQEADVDKQLEVQRLQTAVQFRLGMKLLLENTSKNLLVHLKTLLQQ